MKLFQGVTPNRKVILEIREDDDRPLAHVLLDPETARSVADTVRRCVDIAEGITPEPIEITLTGDRK